MSLKRQTKLLVITPGDPDGIGPEVTWKAIRSTWLKKKAAFLLCVGAREPFDRMGVPVIEARGLFRGLKPPKRAAPFVWLLRAPSHKPNSKQGSRFSVSGFQAGWSIEHAVHLLLEGFADALVTGPISKERLRAGGYRYNGHTDFLASLCSSKRTPLPVTMMLANEQLRVSLVTTHVSVARVSKELTRDKVLRAFNQTLEYLHTRCHIKCPKIAVLGLNPHAGEGGLFGSEEKTIIGPLVTKLKKNAHGKYVVTGPHPSDTFFAVNHAARSRDRQDAVICMYHDQALIPVKLLDFAHTVNVTLGLPIIRTSVDHGVAFDIAGKNQADSSSMCSAIQLALALSGGITSTRKKGHRS